MEQLRLAKATAFDFAEALDEGGSLPIRLSRGGFGLFARQVDAGAAFTWRTAPTEATPGGELVAICGLYPMEGWAEAWWAVGPAMKANLWRALASMRRELEAVAWGDGPLDVRCHIPADSVAGAHVARLFKFRREGAVWLPPWGELAVWRRFY